MMDDERETTESRRRSDREKEALADLDARQHAEREILVQFIKAVSDRDSPSKPNAAVAEILEFLRRDDAVDYVRIGIRGLTLANRYMHLWAATAGLVGVAWAVSAWWREGISFLSEWANAHPPIPPH